MSCKWGKGAEIPAIVEFYDTPEDELEALIIDNYYREKTAEQKAREGMALEEIERKRAKERMLAGLIQNTAMDGASIAEANGTTRDAVAEKVGFGSGRTYSRARNVVNKIDKLKEDGRTEDAELLSTILNQAPTTAEEFSQRVDMVSLDSDTKKGIKNGEISANSVLQKVKSKSDVEPAKTKVTEQDVADIVDEFNAINRGEKEMLQRHVYESDIVSTSSTSPQKNPAKPTHNRQNLCKTSAKLPMQMSMWAVLQQNRAYSLDF